ncbi:hypothetical protein PYCCODRAFT_1379434, partial [Trametes coccinea BRFM310]
VIAIYTRSGGKTGFHSSQKEVKSVGLVSYAVMQVYEHSFYRKFRAIHQDLATLQVFRFLHTPADHILLRIAAKCSLSQDKRTLDIDATAYDDFNRLTSSKQLPAMVEAVKALTKARKAANKQADGGSALDVTGV